MLITFVTSRVMNWIIVSDNGVFFLWGSRKFCSRHSPLSHNYEVNFRGLNLNCKYKLKVGDSWNSQFFEFQTKKCFILIRNNFVVATTSFALCKYWIFLNFHKFNLSFTWNLDKPRSDRLDFTRWLDSKLFFRRVSRKFDLFLEERQHNWICKRLKKRLRVRSVLVQKNIPGNLFADRLTWKSTCWCDNCFVNRNNLLELAGIVIPKNKYI